MTNLEEIQTKKVLVSRYTLDLPVHAEMSEAFLELDGIPVNITPGVLKDRTLREAEKEWRIVELRNKNNTEHGAIREQLPNGTVFQYDHMRITGQGLDGSAINKLVYSTLAYGWVEHLKIKLGNDDTLDSAQQVKNLLSKIKPLQSPPTSHATCFVQGCIEHSTLSESTTILFKFKDFPTLTASFRSTPYIGEQHPTLSDQKLLDYNADDELIWKSKNHFNHHIFRNIKRPLNGYDGEEILYAITQLSEGRYRTEVHATWYYPGRPDRENNPEISIDLGFSYITSEQPSNPEKFSETGVGGSPSHARFIMIWDTMLNSLATR
ncbi:T6SS immunity protein Tli4 family protein [Pseudomonas sp. NPDC089396]|uniref:T6SS immunity protein Tli4 family protein n=1 Tax=Pseudomonas sp. NPDC089396 TaxID=3364461 RepID=UPI00383834A4